MSDASTPPPGLAPVPGVDEAVLASLRQIMRGIDRHSHHLLQACGLTGPQLVLLRTLRDQPGRCAREVADRLHLSQATVSEIVNRLVSRGLVARVKASDDRRRTELRLSDEGHRLLQRAPSPLQETFRRRLLALQDWEQMQILASLRRIAALMAADDLDAAPMLVTGSIGAAPAETPRPADAVPASWPSAPPHDAASTR